MTILFGVLVVSSVALAGNGGGHLNARLARLDARVAKYAANHLFVKLNAEDRAEGQEFARRHQVQGYPMTIVLDSSGRVIAKQGGAFQDAEEFLTWLEQVRQGG